MTSQPTRSRSKRWRAPISLKEGFARRALAFALAPLLLAGGVPGRAQAPDQIPEPVPEQTPEPVPEQAPGQDPGAPPLQPGVPFLGALPPGEAPAAAAPGPTIEAIEIRGLATLSEETLLFYLELAPGQTLNQERLDLAIKQLWDRGLIDDIQVESQPGQAGGVRLLITVAERPVLRSIDYQGLKRVSRTDIQDKISSQSIRAREGDPLSLGELQRIKALIEELYRDKGYRFAQANYAVEDVGPNEKKVVFTVDEGDRVRIADIDFEGNEVFGDARLRWVMKKTKESGLVTRMLKKDIYNPGSLQEDLDKVRDLYRGAGYKNVVIGEPRVDVVAQNPSAPASEQKRRMTLTIPIEEGERWRFGEVTIDGNTTYTDQALLRAFQHRPGSWLRSKVVDEGVKAVTDLYHNTGYIFARVEPELVEKGDRVADLVVHVQEGEQYKVGRIEFEGNERTMDKVLRREIRLSEGRVVSIGAVRNSITKVNQLGYFKLDEEDPVKIDYDSEGKQVNLTFKGEEAERTQLEFGGGWSEVDGFFGQFAINTKNFLGRGEQVGLSFQSGRFRDLFDLSYFIPWFLDRPQTLGFRAFDTQTNFNLLGNQRFLRDSRGGVVSYGRQLGLFQQIAMSYTRSQFTDESPILLPDGSTTLLVTELDNSALRPNYVYDSRDNPFEPTRGRRLSLGVDLVGGFLGGDSEFLRPEATVSIFQPLSEYQSRTMVALNVEAGMIEPRGAGVLSPLDLYYLGGENSIRGHRFRSIFLTDPARPGFGIGGYSFAQFNLEYHVLLGGPFRVLLFADGGNVFAQGDSYDLSSLRYTAGAEMRVNVPVFGAPLRFIYAKRLDEEPQDQPESFQFSIGTSF
jgi:outer membrane protein insertion porin family